MMKKLLIAFAMSLSFCTAAYAQNMQKVEADLDDYKALIKVANNKLFCFDINSLPNGNYTATVIITEYINSESQTTTSCELSGTINNYKESNKLAIYLAPQSDSITKAVFDLKNVHSMDFDLELRPQIVNETPSINYSAVGFGTGDIKIGVEIPLAMYGSYWIDQKYGFLTFESEMLVQPDMSNEVFKKSPHYYVLSVQFDKTTN